jgi:hypothetical protein
MVQPSWQAAAQLSMLGGEVFGDFLKGDEVGGGIAISKRVIGDEVDTVLEELAEVREIGGHG